MAAYTALTLFIPMLMDTGGNSCGQASVAGIHTLSLGDAAFFELLRVVWKELRVAMLCLVTLEIVVFGKAMVNEQKGLIAVVVALTMIIAKLVGCILPLLAKRLCSNPAVIASPFTTTVVDALSLFIYYAISAPNLGPII